MGTHSLRRFFEDNIGHGKLSKYMLNKLTKSEEPYSFKTKNKLEETYLKYMDNLYIFETPKKTKEDLERVKYEIAKKDEEIERLKNSLNVLDKGRKSFEEKYNQYDERFKKIEKQLNIQLNPEIKTTQNKIDYVESLAPILYKWAKGKEGSLEQIKIIKEVLREVSPKVLQEINKLPKAEDKLNPDIVQKIIEKNVNTKENIKKIRSTK